MSQIPAGCEPRCPACPHRKFTLSESEKQKNDWLHHNLAPWSNVLEPIRSPSNTMELASRWGYRDKALLHSRWNTKQSEWEFGVLDRDENLIPIPDCPIHSESVRQIHKTLARLLPAPEVLPLHFASVVGRQVSWVIKAPSLANTDWIQAVWDALRPWADGLWLNCNPAAGDRVFSSRHWQHMAGQSSSPIDFLGTRFEHGPSSFVQLIPELYEHALLQASEFLVPGPKSAVLDLYSGIGVSMALWKQAGSAAIGAELHGESQIYAEKNTGLNCLRGRVEERIPQLEDWTATHRERSHSLLVFANPSRDGLGIRVSEWITGKARPQKIAYLSCNPRSLAQDLETFSHNGYAVKRLLPYDFFPQTRQVETLALIELS